MKNLNDDITAYSVAAEDMFKQLDTQANTDLPNKKQNIQNAIDNEQKLVENAK